MIRTLLYLSIIGALLAVPARSLAERAKIEMVPGEAPTAEILGAIPDEYVVTLSPVRVLREKSKRAIADATGGSARLSKESAHVALVKGKDVCGKIRKKERKQRLTFRGSARVPVLRRTVCDPNARMKINQRVPNDEKFYVQWALNQANDIDINAPEAWALHTGSRGVVVAVIDTGIDYDHPDLAGNVWTNPGEIPGNGIDDDGNGYIDDIHGYNAVNNTGDPMDDHGHGTHVSGTIGAVSNNTTGVAGVNWNIQIVGAKFLESSGYGSLYNAVLAIDYVTSLRQHGVNVILSSNSWGGGGYYSSLRDAISRAGLADILFIAAAGNNGLNIDQNPVYPASYNLANMINVAAVDSNGYRASFSNYGSQTVHIAAPGVNIASTYFGNRYAYMSGTSMATPHVSGAIALIKAMSRDLTASQLKEKLLAGGRVLESLNGVVQTNAMVDLARTIPLLVWNPMPEDGIDPDWTPTPTPVPSHTPTPIFTPTRTPIPTPAQYDLSGMATTSDGTRISGARITVVTTEPNTYTVMTDSNGFFRVNDIWGPTNYTLSASAGGYLFDVQTGQVLKDTNITVRARAVRSYTLTVKAVTNTMLPVPGITIYGTTIGTGTTNSSGVATFTVPYGTSYSLQPYDLHYTFTDGIREGIIYGDSTRVVVGVLNQE